MNTRPQRKVVAAVSVPASIRSRVQTRRVSILKPAWGSCFFYCTQSHACYNLCNTVEKLSIMVIGQKRPLYVQTGTCFPSWHHLCLTKVFKRSIDEHYTIYNTLQTPCDWWLFEARRRKIHMYTKEYICHCAIRKSKRQIFKCVYKFDLTPVRMHKISKHNSLNYHMQKQRRSIYASQKKNFWKTFHTFTKSVLDIEVNIFELRRERKHLKEIKCNYCGVNAWHIMI